MTKLTNLNERALLQKPGRHRVTGNLFLKVLDFTHAYWVVRYSVGGVSREISLGSTRKLNRTDATGRYHAIMAKVNEGVDPLTQKRNAEAAAFAAKADVPTFGDMADAYLKAHEAGWKNSKHRYQWRQTLEGAGVKFADGLVVGGGEAELFGDALGLRCGRAEEGGHFERDGPVWGGVGGLGGLSGSLAVRSHCVDPLESAGGR